MKKQLTVALGLAVLATPAFATKARLQGLGEDIYGSFYVNDNRNIWLNAAQINNHKDLVTFEYGDTNATADQNQSPRAEGGIYKAMGNLVYGIHFGSASNSANQLRAAGGLTNISLDDISLGAGAAVTSSSATANETNVLDVFVGGDAGLKWGANLSYGKSKDEANNGRAESMRSRLGVIMGDTQVYANINLINNAKGQANTTDDTTNATIAGTAKFEGKLGYQVGAIHAWNGNSFTVDFRQFDAESTINSAAAGADNGKKNDQSIKQLQAGWGRVTRLNDKTNLFTRATFVWADAENKGALGGAFGGTCDLSPYFCEEYTTMRIPVSVGLETEATSWLTIRASVQQSVWGKEEDKHDERTIRNNTIVNAGATLKFGELSVDGLVSTSQAAAGTLGENTATGRGTLRLDELMTRVGVNYRF